MSRLALLVALLALAPTPSIRAGDGNRLTYLDSGSDPYYVGLGFPRLTTPQWVGEEGVEAVVVLAIDDMTDNAPKYETYLRPILDRLKAIDGRAPVSIMTCRVAPDDPQVGAWLKEGLSIEVHTLTHPHPLLQKGDFAAAEQTVHGCVDLLGRIPGNRPVAFRMPYCDSKNTPSPRFYAEIFHKTSPEGRFLTIDSSVFNILTPNDPSLPRDLVLDPDGRERFRKYLPFPSFVNTIEDYPYPYVIGRLCWEFPCVVPSDWQAQNLHKPNNPRTVEELKAALDAVVLKQGVFNLVFHPHGWIKAEQVVELIDHAVSKHGKKVKFLNFREAQERLNRNLLAGEPLRYEDDGDNGVRLLDLNADGFMDVIIGNLEKKETRVWDPAKSRWRITGFPAVIFEDGSDVQPLVGFRFGVLHRDGRASMITSQDWGGGIRTGWSFEGGEWVEDRRLVEGLAIAGERVETVRGVGEAGVRLRDLDGDGFCELIVGNPSENAVFAWSANERKWNRLAFSLPAGLRFVEDVGDFLIHHWDDTGLRLVDLDEDGRLDLIASNDEGYGIYLFESMASGWSRKAATGRGDAAGRLPKTVRSREEPERNLRVVEDNGFWVHSRHLWWQNEDTDQLPDHVDRRSFNDLLKDVEPRAKSPEASLKSIRVRPGFQVELVACEPLVNDPIAFDWGPDGKLWVVEMGDYPLGEGNQGKPGGAVKFLEDTDGDGKYDKSTVFLDGLGYPTGVMPWRKGVLVSCAPEIFYAEDRDGDGKADHRESLFTGFKPGNPQHRVNGFAYGLDGWIYVANGDSGGTIRSEKTGKAIAIGGRDLRIRPDEGLAEPESGQTQFGRHRDDWGHWFGNNNSVWAWQYVLAERDVRRNPRLTLLDARKTLDGDGWLFPVSRTLLRFNDLHTANRVTSANSAVPYRDELFGPHFNGNLFVSEPVHNLVHRMVLERVGSTFRCRRFVDEADCEFLASSDNWFRPIMLKTGPDGALWIADMYRAVIEHPEWIPDDWVAKLDLRAGHDQGRIYRVYPVDKTPRPTPRLDRLDAAGLVAALDSPNGWQRDNAQRLLVQFGDRSAIESLRRLAEWGERPKARVQALWTLHGLGALTAEPVSKALADSHAEVRRNGVCLCEGLLKDSPSLGAALLRLADDPEPHVRLQVALALGDWDDPRAGDALASIVRRDRDDLWTRAAVLSSAAPHAVSILKALFASAREGELPREVVESLSALIAVQKDRGGIDSLVAMVDQAQGSEGRHPAWVFSAVSGLLDASGGRLDGKDQSERLHAVFESARMVAADDVADQEDRLQAVRLLGREPGSAQDDLTRLQALLQPRVPGPLQQAAVAALARSAERNVPELLLADWKGHTPALRSAVLDAILGRAAWTASLLSALEEGRLPPAEVGPTHRQRLLTSDDAEVRRWARLVLDGAVGDRGEVVERYRAALATPGDARAGVEVFKRACAACHRLDGVGSEVGPDLAALSDRSPGSLLAAILDPNRAVESRYSDFAVQLADGRVLSGLVIAETANSITLRRPEGREDVLLRADIEAMAGSGKSLMPEGLEKDLTPRDVADLVAYLAASGPPPKTVAGNRPEVVKPRATGAIILRAANAEIYGSSLTLEGKYQNLGLWTAPDDRAGWSFEVERPGRYAVWLDWACADDVAGNGFVLDFGTSRIEGTAAGTGTWDDYRRAKVGEVDLTAGRHRLDARPAGPIRKALMDLRSVELRPLP